MKILLIAIVLALSGCSGVKPELIQIAGADVVETDRDGGEIDGADEDCAVCNGWSFA